MSSGRNFSDQRGRIVLTEPMVAYTYRGKLFLRRYARSIRRSNTPEVQRYTSFFTHIKRAWMYLTEVEQVEWDTYASMVTQSYLRAIHETTGNCGGIIPRRKMPTKGVYAFVQSNMLSFSIGETAIRRKAPLGGGFPPAPTDVSLEYKNGIAIVRWHDPVITVGGVMPSLRKIRIWAVANGCLGNRCLKGQRQIVGVVEIPSPQRVSGGEYTFDAVRVNTAPHMMGVMRIADFASGVLTVQTDTVVADNDEVGAVRSVGSNIDRKSLMQMA